MDEQAEKWHRLVAQASHAYDYFTEDELEDFASSQNQSSEVSAES